MVTCSSRAIDVSNARLGYPTAEPGAWRGREAWWRKCHFTESKRDGDEAGGPCTERDGWLPTAPQWP